MTHSSIYNSFYVMSQLLHHLKTNELWSRSQSAYLLVTPQKLLYLESWTTFLLLVMIVKCLFSLCLISVLPLTLSTMTSSSIGSNMFSACSILLFRSSDPISLKESKRYPFLATVQILPLSFKVYHGAQFSVP